MKRLGKFLRLFAKILLTLLFAGMLVSHIAPRILNRWLVTTLIRQHDTQFTIRHLGFGAIDLANARYGQFAADSIRLDYSWNLCPGEWWLKPAKMQISGLKILQDDGNFTRIGTDFTLNNIIYRGKSASGDIIFDIDGTKQRGNFQFDPDKETLGVTLKGDFGTVNYLVAFDAFFPRDKNVRALLAGFIKAGDYSGSFSGKAEYGDNAGTFTLEAHPTLPEELGKIELVKLFGNFDTANGLLFQLDVPNLTLFPPYGAGKFSAQGNLTEFNGKFISEFFPDLTLAFDGKFKSAADFSLEATIPEMTWSEGVPLGEFEVSGSMSASANVAKKDGVLSSSGRLSVRNGRFLGAENQLELDGINLRLRFDDLIKLHTPSGQQVRIKKLAFAGQNAESLDLRFQLQSPTRYTVESGELGWSGGIVYVPTFAYRMGQKELNLTVYCEKLRLDRMLGALGLQGIDSPGEMYGKIPLLLSPRGIFFEESKLYTVSAEPHHFKMPPASLMGQYVAAMPNGELALESLKNFIYNNAILDFSTGDENLIINFILDGKPAGPLPFRVGSSGNELIRDANASVELQGIKFNLELVLPLNRLLLINQTINNIGGKK